MIHIIGIGFKDIDTKAIEIIKTSDKIITSQRLYERFSTYDIFPTYRDKVIVINAVPDTLTFLKENKDNTITLLASGDPLYHGIGRKVIDEIGKEYVSIYPELSSIQVAFSRIKETWDDAFNMSLHGGLLKGKHKGYVIEDLPTIVRSNSKVSILTDNVNNPKVIAETLIKANLQRLTMYVCQRLGYSDEKVIKASIYEITNHHFEYPNVVVIINDEPYMKDDDSNRPSITEQTIKHKEGLITKDEIRAVVLSKLELPLEGIFWDIGAGSGAVSIEVAIRYPKMRVYAIERDIEQCGFIEENIKTFKVSNVALINATAPQGLTLLPSPDRVFIGGSGGYLKEILHLIMSKASENIRLVLTATMIETLNEALGYFNSMELKVECSQIGLSRLIPISRGNYFKAFNPVFVIKASR